MFRNTSMFGIAGVVASIVASQATAGTISGSISANTSDTNLTTQGVLDWAAWGNEQDGSLNNDNSLSPSSRKLGANLITGITAIQASPSPSNMAQYFGPLPRFSWTDGTPDVTGTNLALGVRTGNGGTGLGFELTAPASLGTNTLQVYFVGFSSTIAVTATLSDGSATPDIDSTGPIGGSDAPLIYTVNYSADSIGQTLTLRFETTASTNPGSGVSIQAATLDGSAIPEPASLAMLAAGGMMMVIRRRR